MCVRAPRHAGGVPQGTIRVPNGVAVHALVMKLIGFPGLHNMASLCGEVILVTHTHNTHCSCSSDNGAYCRGRPSTPITYNAYNRRCPAPYTPYSIQGLHAQHYRFVSLGLRVHLCLCICRRFQLVIFHLTRLINEL